MIDLRSDTVTRPGKGMRAAIARAEVGDDVFSEDPTVNALQEKVAGMLGKEAALFVPSGSMGNQICIHVHTRPGDEMICEAGSHPIHYEGGAMAFLSGVQPMALAGKHGVITLEQVRQAVRPVAPYYPRTRLIALENTHNLAGGTIFPLPEIERIAAFAQENGLRMHLDGARLWNASVATGISVSDYAAYFDSVSVCFSKGLGAPVGSVIAGSHALIEKATRVRKQLGGGMRQAGILAAAGLYALEHNFSRLAEDHENARRFARIVAESPKVAIDMETVQTNIVIMDLQTQADAFQICDMVKKEGVLLVPMTFSKLRAVTHLDVSTAEVEQAARVVLNVLRQL